MQSIHPELLKSYDTLQANSLRYNKNISNFKEEIFFKGNDAYYNTSFTYLDKDVQISQVSKIDGQVIIYVDEDGVKNNINYNKNTNEILLDGKPVVISNNFTINGVTDPPEIDGWNYDSTFYPNIKFEKTIDLLSLTVIAVVIANAGVALLSAAYDIAALAKEFYDI